MTIIKNHTLVKNFSGLWEEIGIKEVKVFYTSFDTNKKLSLVTQQYLNFDIA